VLREVGRGALTVEVVAVVLPRLGALDARAGLRAEVDLRRAEELARAVAGARAARPLGGLQDGGNGGAVVTDEARAAARSLIG